MIIIILIDKKKSKKKVAPGAFRIYKGVEGEKILKKYISQMRVQFFIDSSKIVPEKLPKNLKLRNISR